MRLPCGAGYIDVEADEIAPGYAVLLMYLMLVRGQGEGGGQQGGSRASRAVWTAVATCRRQAAAGLNSELRCHMRQQQPEAAAEPNNKLSELQCRTQQQQP